MPINSRRKGATGERELANVLTKAGFPARRGQQFSGSPDSPDVVCAALSDYHIECKRVERLDLYAALAQSIRDAGGQKPVVMHRRNEQPWVAIMLLEDFLALQTSEIPAAER